MFIFGRGPFLAAGRMGNAAFTGDRSGSSSGVGRLRVPGLLSNTTVRPYVDMSFGGVMLLSSLRVSGANWRLANESST